MIDGELVTIIVNLLLVGGFLWWMLHPRHNNNEEPLVPKTAAENRQNALSDVRRGSKSHGQTVRVSVVPRLRLGQIKFGYKNDLVKCG